MTEPNYYLSSQIDVLDTLSNLFSGSPQVELQVRESKAFQSNSWLSLGTVCLFPPSVVEHDGRHLYSSIDDPVAVAIINGAYTWQLPTEAQLRLDLKACMPGSDDAIKIVSEALQDCCRRLLLIYPTFDPETLSSWPLKRPITIVPDTSGVLQGALDFVSNFLCPMARIKIPAVVALEILSMADRFLTMRRALEPDSSKSALRSKCLREHTKSQGGQRSLLRIELNSDTEIERPVQGSDPIRMIYQPDSESGIKDLNLTTVNRSLADRLVFESAKEHQSRLTATHPICVLTSDQGLARMALCEGINPLFFEARKTSVPLGQTLSGAIYHPFQPKLSAISLLAVLWELATCFGSVRVNSSRDGSFFEATTIDEHLSWYPYHSKENLVWCRWDVSSPERGAVLPEAEIAIDEPLLEFPSAMSIPHNEPSVEYTEEAPNETVLAEEPIHHVIPTMNAHSVTTERAYPTAYVFSPTKMLDLLRLLSIDGTVKMQAAAETLGTKLESFKEYRSFLASGGFIVWDAETITKSSELDRLLSAMRALDLEKVTELLMHIPSFKEFVAFTEVDAHDVNWRKRFWGKRTGSIRALESLVEISGVAVEIPGEGLIRTRAHPDPQQFQEQALYTFNSLAGEDGYVLTGRWLEQLALDYGIHPIRTRQLLRVANEQGYLLCLVEGSTPDTRFENHTLDVLTSDDGKLGITRYHLYRGDFLIPTRAAVRIRLERREP